ncbi:MAG: cation:proton antiporter [Bacteroidaceae bacterium]|nr:cation:proton antiporter [Bacteroidaceae bacterium]
MSELAPLIADLALILVCAGVMTLLFKKLKQPLVLGYIVAGFLASPHLSYTPSVVDNESVHVWADIGVIFLLFALGLEFSFKKIMKVGGSAIIAACSIIFCMIFLGVTAGTLFGWSRMDCLFLGGMLAMSSTTIIYKAFADLDLFKKQFTQLVMSILILEDILAIVLMVLLSTVAVSNNVQGLELLFSIGKLGFFLILWFVVGIWLIPLLLRKTRKLMSDETLLIVSLALCFFMVVIAAKTGFSPAFGAFIMGSILAETVEAEHIDHLVKPVKDLFGAIFFVSVGMMVDPLMIVEYAVPILVITLTIILGQTIFGSLGVLLSGQTLKTSMQCGFSLTQIGEFAFIIASLGVSLGVTSDFLYPIVVAVSVITTFLTPYMIRLAEPASDFVEARLPEKWKETLARYATGTRNVNHDSDWKRFLISTGRSTLIYAIVCVAIVAIFINFVHPFVMGIIPGFWGDLLVAVATICFLSPFLRAIMVKGNHSDEFVTLWHDSKNHVLLLATVVFRILIAILFVMFVISSLFEISAGLLFGLALILVTVMIISRSLKKQSLKIEKIFFKNLRSREVRAEYLGTKKPDYAGRLMSKDIHLADFEVPAEVDWVGTQLKDLNFGKLYGVHVVSILRGKKRINIPKAIDCLYPHDRIQVIGTDADLTKFSKMFVPTSEFEEEEFERGEMILRQFVIDENSPFLGKNLIESGIRNRYHCMIVGVERGSDELHAANPHELFQFGDVIWIVGERAAVQSVVSGTYAISYD